MFFWLPGIIEYISKDDVYFTSLWLSLLIYELEILVMPFS